MITGDRRRRVDAEMSRSVEEAVTIAETVGVLAAFMYMVGKKIPNDVIRRMLRGGAVRGGCAYKIG